MDCKARCCLFPIKIGTSCKAILDLLHLSVLLNHGFSDCLIHQPLTKEIGKTIKKLNGKI